MGIFRRDRAQGSEQRAPQVATATVRGRVGLAELPTMSDDWATRRAYYSNVFVWACANALAEDVASIAFRVGKDPDKPSDFLPLAPLARLLGPPPGGPNPVTSPEALIAWSVVQYLVLGRFAWEIELEGNDRPIGFWPLNVRNLDPIPLTQGAAWWKRFEYRMPEGGEKELRPEQVFYQWRPSTENFRKPESVLEAARLDIDVAVMQDRYDKAFLQNDARPAAVVVHEQFSAIETRDAWREKFMARHRGPDAAGSMEFVETSPDGATPAEALAIHQIGLSQADGEFIKRYEAKIRGILVAFGVPLSRLGDSSARTYSNADRESVNYWKHKVAPIARQLAAGINMQLAPRFGREVGWFDLTKIESLRVRRFKTMTEAISAFEKGAITREELREEANLSPEPDGTMFADLAAPALPAAAPAAEEPEEPTEPVEPVVDEDPDRAAAAEAAEVVAEQARARQWATTDMVTRNLERDFERRAGRLFAAQLRATIDRLEGKRGRQALRRAGVDPETGDALAATPQLPSEIRAAADEVFDRAFWELRTAEEFLPGYEAVFTVAGGQIAAGLGIDFDLDDPFAVDFVQARANQLAGNVTATTYRGIQSALADGIAAGEGIPGLSARIRDLFEQTYAGRSETVARTEVISAYNGSAYTVGLHEGADVVAGYEWIAARDPRTRDSHRHADGQKTYVGLPFNVGSSSMLYPGDPSAPAAEVVNCRCSIGLLTPEEMGGVLAGDPTIATLRSRVPADRVARMALDVAAGRLSGIDAAAQLVGVAS
jgi:HK97 family phage portal protein